MMPSLASIFGVIAAAVGGVAVAAEAPVADTAAAPAVSTPLLITTLIMVASVGLLFLLFAAYLGIRLQGPMAGLGRRDTTARDNNNKPGTESNSKAPCVTGFVAPGFEEVRQVLESLVQSGMEDNVQACAYLDGKVVVDLVGRFNPSGGIGSIYTNASVQNVFSSTKAITSVVMAMLVDRGHISYDTPVATLWPEFAQYDKEDITLSDVLRHESGLHEFDFALNGDDLHREKLKDRNSVVRHKIAMAKKRRHHGRHHHKDHHKSSHHHSKSNDKGDQHQEHQRAEDQSSESSNNSNKSRAYHAITRGWILNEICQRVDPHKRTVGEFIRDEIARPLGISKELTLGTETLALLEGGDNSLVPLKHTPLSWLILEICNIFNRRMPLRFLMVSIALKNLNFVYWIAGLLGLKSRLSSTTPAIVPNSDHDPQEHLHPVELFNHNSVRAAEIPSANGHASGRALAKVAALMANGGAIEGVRLLSPEGVHLAMSDPVERYDEVLKAKTKFTLGGWAVFDTGVGYKREGCVGWFGIGGSAIQWNSDLNLGFGYGCNLFGASLYNYNSYLVQKAVIDSAKRVKYIATK